MRWALNEWFCLSIELIYTYVHTNEINVKRKYIQRQYLLSATNITRDKLRST